MCGCDHEQPSAFWETKRKAKKRHKCSECRGWIEVGEVYTATRGVWDGSPSSYKTCSDCWELSAWAESKSECLCLLYGQWHLGIMDDAHDSGDAAYAAEVDARIKAIRNKRRDAVAA